jgi:hypothetical protein
MMELEDQYRFEVDVMVEYGGVTLDLTCRRCGWVCQPDSPITLAELNQRADEHAEVCR